MTDSLIDRASRQLQLLASADMPDDVFHADEDPGRRDEYNRPLPMEFTGERLFSRDPDRYMLIVGLLAEGTGIGRIGRLLHVSPNTVMAVRDREGTAIDMVRERLAKRATYGAELCIEAIIEDLSDPKARSRISTRDKSIIAGVLADKGELLAGKPTVRVETSSAEPGHGQILSYLESLRAEASEMGLRGGNGGQKGDPRDGAIDAEFTMQDGPAALPADTAPELDLERVLAQDLRGRGEAVRSAQVDRGGEARKEAPSDK